MIKQSDPLLLIFNKICKNKNKRLDSENLKLVISNVRIMQKRGDPAGCSNNPNAGIKDLDLALEKSKRREQDFDEIISKEMSRMNFVKDKDIKKEKIKQDEESIEESNEEMTPNPDEYSLTPIPENRSLNKTIDGVFLSHDDKKLDRTVDGIFLSRRDKKIDTLQLSQTPENQGKKKAKGILLASRNNLGRGNNALKAYSARNSTRRSKVTQEFLIRISTPANKYDTMPSTSRPETIIEKEKYDSLIKKCTDLNKDMKKVKNIKNLEESESIKEKIRLTEFLKGTKSRKKNNNDKNYLEEQVQLDLRIAKSITRGKKI